MKKFKKIYIEITNICNLNCNFCPPTKRTAQSMTIEQFETIATKMRPFGDYLYLHIKGEPLIHKNLNAILLICEKLKFKVCITTNGTLIQKNLHLLLSAKSIHKMHISLHSFEASEINLTIDQYILGIAELIKNASFLVVLRLWNDGGANKLNDFIIAKLKTQFTFLRDDKINDKTYIESGEKFEWADLNSNISNQQGFCYALRDQIGILVDGTVVPCCLDNDGDINLGNILHQPLEEILNSKRAKDLYDGFSKRTFSEKLCTTCGFIDRFSK